MNRDLTTGVLEIRTKKETVEGRRDRKGTLDRLLAFFCFLRYFQSKEKRKKKAPDPSEDATAGDWLPRLDCKDIIKQNKKPCRKQRDNDRAPLRGDRSAGRSDSDTTTPFESAASSSSPFIQTS